MVLNLVENLIAATELRTRKPKMRVEDDRDYCEVCERIVPEGTEHDWQAHGSTKEYADELSEWKRSLKQ